MEIILMVLILGFAGCLEATHCDKELNYHDRYGYGFDITCEGLNNETSKMLKNISAYNEMILRINNSNLTHVTKDLFANVPKLKILVITNSTFLFGSEEEPFINLQNLEQLTIENTTFNNINVHTFQRLELLKELNLLNCNLHLIHKESFKLLINLEVLKLTRNHFTTVYDVPVCELPKLKHFHIDHNHIKVLDKSNFFCYNQNIAVGLKLNKRTYPISSSNFMQSKNSTANLIELNLSYNNITKIDIFDWAFQLKIINLESNKLKLINDKLFSLVNYLERLNLKDNLLENCTVNAFARLERLKFINLENNNLTVVHLQKLIYLEEIILTNNKIISDSLQYLNNLPKLKNLLLNKNNLTELPINVFKNFSSLILLDLSDNKIILKNETFKGLRNLNELRIKNNDLMELPGAAINYLPNLEILDISVNKIDVIVDPQTFSGLLNLQILNISYNNLEHINYDLLKSLHNLQVLDIAGNRLQNFQFSLISMLPSLRVFNIKSNLLSCDILSNLIFFLKSKNVSYTINEEFEYDRKNVEGIYCEETADKLRRNEIQETKTHVNASSAIGILLLVVASCIIISVVIYKFLQFSRRRRYMMDEIELIEG